MSLYGRTDSNANKTKAGRGVSPSSQAKEIIFIDDTEAALDANKSRGLNAPGWWSYYTYTDCDGNTRHKAEHLVTIANPDLNANETQADDAQAADVEVLLALTSGPDDVLGLPDGHTGALFPITATATGDAIGATIQVTWQKQTPNGTRWTNMTNANSTGFIVTNVGSSNGERTARLDASNLQKTDWDGYKFRVKLTTSTGAEELVSEPALLTFA